METIVAPHIRLDAAGVAWIEGTATKVLEQEKNPSSRAELLARLQDKP